MTFIQTLDWVNLVNRISACKHYIFAAIPSIDEEMAELLIMVKKENNPVIKVCIDNREETIRNGYGDEKGIDKLLQNSVIIKESEGNRISFFIIDEEGFIFFPESRILSGNPSGPNAVVIDAITISRLIAHYFSPENIQEKEELEKIFNKGLETQKGLLSQIKHEVIEQKSESVSKKFNLGTYAKTKESLKRNPPLEPDLQRRIKTYTAKVQFVELRFSGINLQGKIISIPKDAIPISDPELKSLLLTKMKLFQDIGRNEGFKVFSQLRDKVNKLRGQYLKPITCRENKSIIQVEMKGVFQEELQSLKHEIQQINQNLPDILEKSVFHTKEILKSELLKYFHDNPPIEINLYQDYSIKEKKLQEYIDGIIYHIKFPKMEKLIENITIKEYYYDLTFQDFSDEKFIEELKRKNILKGDDINGIVEMKNAFGERS